MVMRRTAAIGCAVVLLGSCSQNLESVEFNAYFYYPDDREEFLGTVTGLSSCQIAASAKAKSLGMSSNWSYVCCLKTNSSNCAEKHK